MKALYTEMIDKARHRPESLYGSSPEDIARGKQQTLAVANAFPSVIQDLIALGVKTHFIYYVVAKNNAYRQPLPDVFENRPGQMDAFGIASGLVAIHTGGGTTASWSSCGETIRTAHSSPASRWPRDCRPTCRA